MSFTKEVPCPHCDGTGLVTDYDALDVTLGSDVVPEHTKTVQCPKCLGQGHVRENPVPERPNDP